MKDKTLEIILSKKNHRERVILATEMITGKQIFIDEKSNDKLVKSILNESIELLKNDKSGLIKINDSSWFINLSLPPLRLVIVGAVHIAQPLAKIAATTGYEVTIIDPRASFATDKRFPNIKIINDWPEEALLNFNIDNRTAIVTLTHDPKLDDAALNAALLKLHDTVKKSGKILFVGTKKQCADTVKELANINENFYIGNNITFMEVTCTCICN